MDIKKERRDIITPQKITFTSVCKFAAVCDLLEKQLNNAQLNLGHQIKFAHHSYSELGFYINVLIVRRQS